MAAALLKCLFPEAFYSFMLSPGPNRHLAPTITWWDFRQGGTFGACLVYTALHGCFLYVDFLSFKLLWAKAHAFHMFVNS